MKLPNNWVWPEGSYANDVATDALIYRCAAICRAQIQAGPSASLFIAAQNTMAAQCAEEIERAFKI